MTGSRAAAPDRAGFAAGVFLLDKPAGISSFGVVSRVRRALGMKKVGHAGTLDPFATGLLIVCAGRPATRHISRFMGGRKLYRAGIRLGVETETQDPEGRVIRTAPVPDLDRVSIENRLREFVGSALQTPPAYSAVKHRGKPLYWYARRGITVVKDPRPVEIYTIRCLGYDGDAAIIDCEIECSPGTYIRTLAAEIGDRFGCGAHLASLRRLGSGPFRVEQALPLRILEADDGPVRLLAAGLEVEEALAVYDPDQGQA